MNLFQMLFLTKQNVFSTYTSLSKSNISEKSGYLITATFFMPQANKPVFIFH